MSKFRVSVPRLRASRRLGQDAHVVIDLVLRWPPAPLQINRLGCGKRAERSYLGQEWALADFNGDGKLDAATCGATQSGRYPHNDSWAIALGNGNGTFQAPQVFPGPDGDGCKGAVSADFDGDGKADVALSGWNASNITVLFGKGDGTFPSRVDYPTARPSQIFVVDLNGDGRPDIFSIGDLNGYKVQPISYINNGNRTFSVVQTGLAR